MKRIVWGLGMIAFMGAVVVGGTGAFFGDTERASGNTFAAGAIDLKIDNESYYNGNKCTEVSEGVWQWQGNALYPVVGEECTTSFNPEDLDDGLLFFNFRDLKPDDEGEDTISIHVQNDAFVCLDMTLTSDDDISTNEPEGQVDEAEDINDTWDGELAETIEMFWWADDGDNVYEEGENPITDGVQSITSMFGEDKTFSVALADAENNIWGEEGPVPAEETVYIAKAWCMGDMTLDPVQDNGGVNPSVNPGVDCDGKLLGNETQTDGVTLDIAFRAIQARNNPGFICGDEEPRTASLTVIKQIVNDNGGDESVTDFQLLVIGTVATPVTSGVETDFAPGEYFITESGVNGYQATFSGDCDADGDITLAPGDHKTCTITNNDLPATITLIKNVINDNGGFMPSASFKLRVDGVVVPQNTSYAVSANSPHTISEDPRAGYAFTEITGSGCPATLPGDVTLNEGQAIFCFITNDDIPVSESIVASPTI